jgi:hypothetical protein
MGSPSFLGHQRALEEGHGRSNCQTLFGMTAIPTDPHIRKMLDGALPSAFDALFFKTIATEGVLDPFRRPDGPLNGRTLIAVDGTEHFCSRKMHCARCSSRKRTDGGTEYFHAFLGASIVAPGHKQVLPLPPEYIVPQDGAEKQDCERNELRVCAARSRRRSSVGRTRGVGEWVGLWRFHPGRSLSRMMIAGQEARPEEHDPRIMVGSVTFSTVDGVIWVKVRGFGCVGDSGCPWRAGARGNKTERRWRRVVPIMVPSPAAARACG